MFQNIIKAYDTVDRTHLNILKKFGVDRQNTISIIKETLIDTQFKEKFKGENLSSRK